VRFWDASAVVALLSPEPSTRARESLLRRDPALVVWWGTHTECAAALARKGRERGATAADVTAARNRLSALAARWFEVPASPAVRQMAERILNTHVLRAADALQLAAALVACDGEPSRLPFVCADRRLTEAAAREGFTAVP
jgi:uncharacterized protein